ncbi:MAG: 2-amino-4-hydroxy-6-hydroxymethyldihydropteridine diphosphokinase [Verrucomicrobia bacterium]|nr:2-amino-4-hydroxy-6-hydroxymethyldihydropteridine diphosphokinase [Cytophagales bacterium]
MENTAYLLLGSNLGESLRIFEEVKTRLVSEKVSLIKVSGLYQTSAWGLENQPAFLNQVLKINTFFSAFELLDFTQHLEDAFGRQRIIKYGARTLDIDILYFNSEIIDSLILTIPHPQIPFRRFTLVPLAEISPDFIHPILNKTQQQLLEVCLDSGKIQKLSLV